MPNKDFFSPPVSTVVKKEKKWRAFFFSSPLKRPIFCFIYFQTMNTKTTISPSKLIFSLFFFCGSIFLPPRSHNFYAAFPQVSFLFLRVYEIKKLKRKKKKNPSDFICVCGVAPELWKEFFFSLIPVLMLVSFALF